VNLDVIHKQGDMSGCKRQKFIKKTSKAALLATFFLEGNSLVDQFQHFC